MDYDPNREVSPILKVEALSKEFGYKRILKEVTFSLFAGQTTLLVGRNGAGKSTLIKILCGLMRPTSGKVFYRGSEINQQPEVYRKAFGLISHENLFYGDLTARENLRFFGQLGGVENLKGKIEVALSRVNLEPVADVPAKTFSSGMGKRLNIARLMVLEPEILFLDEPYSGLDFDSMGLLNHFLDDVKKRGGTVLMISHQVDTCFGQCDRMMVLADGCIRKQVERGETTPDQLLTLYQSAAPGGSESKHVHNEN